MSATTTEAPADLTDRQREVLALHREGKTPTEIGKALDITSQGVHGHLKRLANRGLIEHEPAPRESAPSRSRSRRANSGKIDPAAALDAVRRTAQEQLDALDRRVEQIDAQIKELQAEKRELGNTRKQLEAHLS